MSAAAAIADKDVVLYNVNQGRRFNHTSFVNHVNALRQEKFVKKAGSSPAKEVRKFGVHRKISVAIDHKQKSFKEGMRLFAYEMEKQRRGDTAGARFFFAMADAEFFHMSSKLADNQRCFHEILASNDGFKLFLDIDIFCESDSKERSDMDTLLRKFIDWIGREILPHECEHVKKLAFFVYEFDASDESYFSRHIIINNFAFKDMENMKSFVIKLKVAFANHPDVVRFCNEKNVDVALILKSIDTTPYRLNGQFRLPFNACTDGDRPLEFVRLFKFALDVDEPNFVTEGVNEGQEKVLSRGYIVLKRSTSGTTFFADSTMNSLLEQAGYKDEMMSQSDSQNTPDDENDFAAPANKQRQNAAPNAPGLHDVINAVVADADKQQGNSGLQNGSSSQGSAKSPKEKETTSTRRRRRSRSSSSSEKDTARGKNPKTSQQYRHRRIQSCPVAGGKRRQSGTAASSKAKKLKQSPFIDYQAKEVGDASGESKSESPESEDEDRSLSSSFIKRSTTSVSGSSSTSQTSIDSRQLKRKLEKSVVGESPSKKACATNALKVRSNRLIFDSSESSPASSQKLPLSDRDANLLSVSEVVASDAHDDAQLDLKTIAGQVLLKSSGGELADSLNNITAVEAPTCTATVAGDNKGLDQNGELRLVKQGDPESHSAKNCSDKQTEGDGIVLQSNSGLVELKTSDQTSSILKLKDSTRRVLQVAHLTNSSNDKSSMNRVVTSSITQMLGIGQAKNVKLVQYTSSDTDDETNSTLISGNDKQLPEILPDTPAEQIDTEQSLYERKVTSLEEVALGNESRAVGDSKPNERKPASVSATQESVGVSGEATVNSDDDDELIAATQIPDEFIQSFLQSDEVSVVTSFANTQFVVTQGTTSAERVVLQESVYKQQMTTANSSVKEHKTTSSSAFMRKNDMPDVSSVLLSAPAVPPKLSARWNNSSSSVCEPKPKFIETLIPPRYSRVVVYPKPSVMASLIPTATTPSDAFKHDSVIDAAKPSVGVFTDQSLIDTPDVMTVSKEEKGKAENEKKNESAEQLCSDTSCVPTLVPAVQYSGNNESVIMAAAKSSTASETNFLKDNLLDTDVFTTDQDESSNLSNSPTLGVGLSSSPDPGYVRDDENNYSDSSSDVDL